MQRCTNALAHRRLAIAGDHKLLISFSNATWFIDRVVFPLWRFAHSLEERMLPLMRVVRRLTLITLVVVSVAEPSMGFAMPMPGDGPPTAMDVSSNTGDATMSIPIPVPPGTGGFVPELALTYSSSGGDGPFGVGWSLEFGELRRSIRFGVPEFNDSTDKFELSGQLLVPNPADSNGTQTRYHTSTETFVRIYHIKSGSDDYWEATRPDGTKLRYGLTATGNPHRILRDGDSGPIYRWLLTEMVDPFGNAILFTHLKDGGEAYPLKVEYTYRGQPRAPVGTLRSVNFVYEARTDSSLTFMGGVRRSIVQRADRIEVKAGSTIFRKLELTYADQPGAGKTYFTGRSRLASMQMFGVGGTEGMPPQAFEYRDPVGELGAANHSNWSAASVALPSGVELAGPNGEDRGVRFAEINGDGRVDLVKAYEAADGTLTHQVFLHTGSGWTLDPSWSAALALNPAQLAASGRKLRYRYRLGSHLEGAWLDPTSNLMRFASAIPETLLPPVTIQPLEVYEMEYTPGPTWRLVDISGDGRADLVSSYSIDETGGCDGFETLPAVPVYTQAFSAREVWINTGEGWTRDDALSTSLPPLLRAILACQDVNSGYYGVLERRPEVVGIADVDGDLLADIVLSTEVHRQTGSSWALLPQYTPAGSPLISQLADVNSDGLVDVVSGNVDYVQLNTGDGWCENCSAMEVAYRLPVGFSSGMTPTATQLVDLNGDRLLDVLRSDGAVASSEGLRAWVQDPTAPNGSVWRLDARFAPPMATQVADGNGVRTTNGVQVLDFDADGAVDFVDLRGSSHRRGVSRFGDLLARLENGRGGVVEYSYESAAKQQFDLYDQGVDAVINDAEGILNWTTRPVVTSRRMSGIEVQPVIATFLYSQPRFDLQEKMSLGFAGSQRRIAGQMSGDRFYEQRRGVAGAVRVETVGSLQGGACGERLRKTNTYEVLFGNDPAVGQGSTATARVGRLTGSISSKSYGVSALCGGPGETIGSATVRSFEYDPKNGDPYRGYNFVTRTTTERRTGTVVETRRMRAPDPTRWIVGLSERGLITGAAGELSKMEVVYGSEGRPIEMTAYEGARGSLASAIARTTSTSYDGFGNIRSMTDPANRTTAFCFDGDASFTGGGSCSSPTNEQTHSVVVAVRDPLAEVTTFKPDSTTGKILEVSPLYSGNKQKEEFDAFGRVKRKLFQPTGQNPIVLAEMDYFALNADLNAPQEHREVRASIGPGGGPTIRTAVYLDGFGEEVRTVNDAPRVNGSPRYFGVSTRGNMSTMQVVTTMPSSCGADPHCLALSTASLPSTTVFRDALGRELEIQAPTGVSKFDYRSVMRPHPDYSGNRPFDAVLEMNARGYLTQRIFDANNALIWVEECGNPVIGSPASADLRNISCQISGPASGVTFYRYEATGELREVYDALASSITDPSKATLRYVRDSFGRVAETYDINKAAVVRTMYDEAGKVKEEVNARGQLVKFEYDELGRPETTSYPFGAGVTQEYSVEYDSITRKQSRVRQRNVTSSGENTVFTQEFDYDSLGRVIRSELKYGGNPALVTGMDFDLIGRTTRVRYPDLNTEVAYEYEAGYLRRVCELAGASACAASGAIPYISSIDYDGIGRETGVTGSFSAGSPELAPVMSFVYDPNTFRLNNLKVSNFFQGASETLDLSYGYDEIGSVLTVTDNSIVYDGSADIALGAVYTYDARNRLRSWAREGQTKYFNYDKVGNLVGKGVGSPTEQDNQTYDPQRRHRVVQAGGTVYGYDADGNVTQRGAQQFAYDPLNRISCIGPSGSCQAFTYALDGVRLAGGGGATPLRIFVEDLFEWQPGTARGVARIFALGRQVATKTIGATALRTGLEFQGIPIERITPLVFGGLLAAGVAALLSLFLYWGLHRGLRLRPAYGGLAFGLILMLAVPPHAWAGFSTPPGQGTYRRWVWQDRGGSSLYITDDAGLVMHQRAFDPFGGIAEERGTPPEFTERTFAGHEFDEASGVYYMNARWYDPATGRFLSTDPVVRAFSMPQSINAYSYVENNPTNLVDPTGKEAFPGECPPPATSSCTVVFDEKWFERPQETSVLFGKIELFPGGIGSSSSSFDELDEQEEDGEGLGLLDGLQLSLDAGSIAADATGVLGPFSFVPDVLNGFISLGRRDFVGAGLSTIAAIPYLGIPGNAARIARIGRAGERAVEALIGIARNADPILVRIPGTGPGGFRVPDFDPDLTIAARGTVVEVKNVQVLQITTQIRDLAAYAASRGVPLEIFTTQNALNNLPRTGDLATLIRTGAIVPRLIP